MASMASEIVEIKAVFRVWNDGGEVIALFPEVAEGPGMCLSYMHIGQHGGAQYPEIMDTDITREALPAECEDLRRELIGWFGYRFI